MYVYLYDLLDVLDLVHELHLCHPPDVLELPDRPDRPDHTQQKQKQQKQVHALQQRKGARKRGRARSVRPPLLFPSPLLFLFLLCVISSMRAIR